MEPVRVARAANLAEAELIQGLLAQHGVPSVTRRSAGFDVPDFMAAGPRDVLVPPAGRARALEILGQQDPPLRVSARQRSAGPVVLLAVLVAGLALGLAVVWLCLQAAG
ncbi:MAG TPA: hypothetical protein VKV27_00335 [Solirubrobacteraceae bacterium]|nr:hypothetical protein [Solirubrobacteraceae bacterium]